MSSVGKAISCYCSFSTLFPNSVLIDGVSGLDSGCSGCIYWWWLQPWPWNLGFSVCLPMDKAERNIPMSLVPFGMVDKSFSYEVTAQCFQEVAAWKKKEQNQQNTFKIKLKNQTTNSQEGSYFWPSKYVNFATFIKLGILFQKTLDSKFSLVIALFGHKTKAHLWLSGVA